MAINEDRSISVNNHKGKSKDSNTVVQKESPIFKFKEIQLEFLKIQSINFYEISSSSSNTYFSIKYSTYTVLYEISDTIQLIRYLEIDYKEICFLTRFSYYILNKKNQLLKNNDVLEEDVLNICLWNEEIFYLKKEGQNIILFKNHTKLFEFPFKKQTKMFKIRNTIYVYIESIYKIEQRQDLTYSLEKYNISNLEKQFLFTADDSKLIYFYNKNNLVEFNKEINTAVNKIEFPNLQSINWFKGDLYLADSNYLYLMKDMKIIKKCVFKTKGAVPVLTNNLLITEFVTFIREDLNTQSVLVTGLKRIDYISGLSLYKNTDECIIKNPSNNEVLANIKNFIGPIKLNFDIKKRIIKVTYNNQLNEEEVMKFKGIDYNINIVYNQRVNTSSVQYLSEHTEKFFEIKNMFLKQAIKYNDCVYCISDNSIVRIDLSSMDIQIRQSPDLCDLYVDEGKIVVEFSKEKFCEREVFWGTK